MARSALRAVETVFLDRDGTINVKAPTGRYITNPKDLVLLPGTGEAVAALNSAGLRTILVTNQRWLSDPSSKPKRYAAVQARLEELLASYGARLDGTYHCPHALAECRCRKPEPGMLFRAARQHRFDVTRAVTVGDSATDLQAGRSAGTATILLRTGAQGRTPDLGADAVVEDLAAAVRLILTALETQEESVAPD